MGLVLAPPGSFSQDLAGRSLFLLQPLFSCLSLTEAPLTVLRMASVTQCPTQWVTHGSPEHHQSLLAELRGLQRQPGHSRTRTPSHGDATQDGHPRSDPSSAAHVVAPPQMTARAATEGCPGHPQGGANPCRDRGPPPEPGPPPPPPGPGPLLGQRPPARTGTPPRPEGTRRRNWDTPPRQGCPPPRGDRDPPMPGPGSPPGPGTCRRNWAPHQGRDPLPRELGPKPGPGLPPGQASKTRGRAARPRPTS